MPTAGPVVLERTWPFVRSRTYIHGTFTNCTRNHPAPKCETPLAASPARATSGSRCLNLGQPFDAEPIQRANPVATGTTTMRVVDGKSGVRHSRRGGGHAVVYGANTTKGAIICTRRHHRRFERRFAKAKQQQSNLSVGEVGETCAHCALCRERRCDQSIVASRLY